MKNLPWASSTYERTIEAYQELLGDIIANRRKSIDLIAREQLIRGSLLKYDFTKRQLIILMFIMTFSFNLCKEWAFIPKLSDFEVAGISKFKIKNELIKMLNMRVIEWNQEENLFRITEPKYWDTSINVGYKDKRSRDLFLLNLEHAGMDISPIIQKIKKMDG